MFIKYFYKIVYIILRVYWYIFRPKTFGALCLIQLDNNYLLIKNTYGSDIWKLPGGGVRKSELPEKAVMREVKEELNIMLSNVTLIETLISKAEYKIDTIYIFHTMVKSKDFIFDKKEINDAKWFSRQEITDNTNIFVLKALESLKQ